MGLPASFFQLQKDKAARPHEEVTWIEVKKEKAQEKPRPRERIVQTQLKKPTEKATENAFLGAQNQVVEKETVSLRKEAKSQSQNRMTRPSPQTKSGEALKGLAKLGLALPHFTTQQEKHEELQPNWVNPSNMEAQDFVQGLKESDQTALNTKEYVFYSYFQRIRERLDRAWVPILQARLKVYFKTGRSLASDMNHTTQVMVYLNTKGEVIRVQLVGESGTRDLDDAAVNAFNEAGPFPNPPQGLVDSTGLIRISWDFVLKT